MRDYIQPVINQVVSIRGYIIYTLSSKIGRTPWIVEYVIFIGLLYIFAVYILHKIYRFFVSSVNKQKEKYFYTCDSILYDFQIQSLKENQNLDRIKDFITQGSYEKSYNLFLEKISLLSQEDSDRLTKQLKKTYSSYKNASTRKNFCGFFVVMFTLGFYKLFLEN